MKLSRFGDKIARGSGIGGLMEDLGNAQLGAYGWIPALVRGEPRTMAGILFPREDPPGARGHKENQVVSKKYGARKIDAIPQKGEL